MKVIKNIFSQLHTFILWAMVSILLWGWIYTFVADAPRAQKVTVFINAVAIDDRALTLRLEETLPAGIKKIKVHDFAYDMFGTSTPGDIFIVSRSQLEEMLAGQPGAVVSFEPPEGFEPYLLDGKCVGVRIFDAATQTGAGANLYIRYAPFDKPGEEDYFLCFGSETWHLNGAKEAKDNAAWEVAMTILALESK